MTYFAYASVILNSQVSGTPTVFVNYVITLDGEIVAGNNFNTAITQGPQAALEDELRAIVVNDATNNLAQAYTVDKENVILL